jgi:hypothetical protein
MAGRFFDIIWEHMIGPVAEVFSDLSQVSVNLRRKVPAIYFWSVNPSLRHQRNANAHRCGVMIGTRWRDETLELSAFNPADLFDKMVELYPPLLLELEEVIQALD